MANCINSTTFRHSLTEENKQDTKTTDTQEQNSKQTKEKQYGRKINIK
jgi:hypothetical protein